MPGLLRMRVDEHREIFPVAKPDADDLDKFMFETDSPYAEARVMRG
jgi:Tat protein secretion system quality control protein TatD with DNase activity